MVVTWLAGLGRIKADEKNGNGNENFSISDDGVWQRLSRPAPGRRERGVSETRRFEKKPSHRRGVAALKWVGRACRDDLRP